MRSNKINKNVMDSKLIQISNVFSSFFYSTTRRHFGEVIKNETHVFQHVALQCAHVHEMTLCVTYFALHVPNHFRFITRCSKYIVIPMLLGTHVPPDPLCVTFFARLRSVPPNLLDRLLAAQSAKAAQTGPGGDRLGRQGPPGMLSRPYFGMPAATS